MIYVNHSWCRSLCPTLLELLGCSVRCMLTRVGRHFTEGCQRKRMDQMTARKACAISFLFVSSPTNLCSLSSSRLSNTPVLIFVRKLRALRIQLLDCTYITNYRVQMTLQRLFQAEPGVRRDKSNSACVNSHSPSKPARSRDQAHGFIRSILDTQQRMRDM